MATPRASRRGDGDTLFHRDDLHNALTSLHTISSSRSRAPLDWRTAASRRNDAPRAAALIIAQFLRRVFRERGAACAIGIAAATAYDQPCNTSRSRLPVSLRLRFLRVARERLEHRRIDQSELGSRSIPRERRDAFGGRDEVEDVLGSAATGASRP